MKHLTILLLLNVYLFTASPVSAQTPSNWQTQATGLRTQNNAEKKTAGLGFIVQQQDWPFLSLRGGVQDAYSWMHPYTVKASSTGVELGQITVPGTSGTFSSEAADWSHNEMTFAGLKLTASRLSSAILVQSTANSLGFLAGNVSGNTLINNQWGIRQATALPVGPRSPKYAAFSSGVQSLTNSPITIPSNQNWLLLWYGTNSHFIDTKNPMSYDAIPAANAWQADAPILLVFQNPPTTISQSSSGGVELNFSSGAGSVIMLPLFGREILRAGDTENWKNGLPSSVTSKINFWLPRLCYFPTSVSESYGYESNTDTATITENISYTQVCSNGTKFAPIQPFLAIAKDSLKVNFSGAIIDGNLPTEYGPTLGIDNADSYTWQVTGLNKYVNSTRNLGNGAVPSQLEQELNTEVTKLISGGHWRPWIFTDQVPRGITRGALHWANPADTINHLSEVIPAIADQTVKDNLVNYLKSEKASYPPEDVFDLSISQGTLRKPYTTENSGLDWSWSPTTSCTGCQKSAHLTRVGLYNFYSLSKYYEITGESLPSAIMTKANTALDKDMKEQDWATGYWFDGFQDRRIAVVNANRHLAGMIGLVRLAKTDSLARALLTKAVVTRIAMAKYPRYLYVVNLIELPSDPVWMAKYLREEWTGRLINYNWSGSFEDARQVGLLHQYGIILNDSNAFWSHGGTQTDRDTEWDSDVASAELIAFKDMVPEAGRIMADFAKQDAEVYIRKSEALWPHWYASFSEGTLGNEHNLTHPVDPYQIFMAKAWIQKETAANLTKYLDNPWLTDGSDLFYLQRLSETIKAYRGWTWSDVGPAGKAGDINLDGQVDIIDMKLVLSNFRNPYTIFDLSTVISNFGK